MIADQAAAKALAPAHDSTERGKLLEWLNFLTTKVHKSFGPMFAPALNEDAKAFFRDRAMGKLKHIESQLAGRDYLMGNQFTVADGYLFTMILLGARPTEADPLGAAQPGGLQRPGAAARPKVQEA